MAAAHQRCFFAFSCIQMKKIMSSSYPSVYELVWIKTWRDSSLGRGDPAILMSQHT